VWLHLSANYSAAYEFYHSVKQGAADELRTLSEKGALGNAVRQIARDEAKRHDLRGKRVDTV